MSQPNIKLRSVLAFFTVITLVLWLSGCAVAPKKPEVIVPDAAVLVRKINIDPKLLVDCDPNLAELMGPLPADALDALARSKSIHDVCYSRLHEIIGVVKTAFPTEVPHAADSASSPKP